MASHPPPESPQPGPRRDEAWMELGTEALRVSKRVSRTLVRLARTTRTREVLVEKELARETVVVERVLIDRVVEAVPPVRQEGDTMVVPVVAEELVLVRRLVLKEEVRLRRTHGVEPFRKLVTLREQQVSVTRTNADGASEPHRAAPANQQDSDQNGTQEKQAMSQDTIVALYDTAPHAQAAADALRQAGVPNDAITLHAGDGTASGSSASGSSREPGFWSNLFGGESSHDAAVYDRSLEAGSTVLSVRAPEEHAAKVMAILDDHHPIDVDERGAGYGLSQSGATTASVVTSGAAPVPRAGTASTTEPEASYAAAARSATPAHGEEASMQLSEETLAVGKRAVNRGGTRIRRYVVETPVAQDVTLHDEKVVLERRPVSDGRPVSADEFSDKTIEMTETAEEAVVSKTAHVYEEVGLRKQAADRVETVRDTVRKEEVEVEQLPGTAHTTTTPGTTKFTTPRT